MVSMYNRDKHWLGCYKDTTYQYKPKPFGSKMGGCPCNICWKANNEYKIIHTINSIPYRREVV